MGLFGRMVNRLADYAYLPAFSQILYRANRGHVMCYLYHRVTADDRHAWLARAGGVPTMTPSELSEDIKLLQELGAEFVTFKELRVGKWPAPGKVGALICFDDGFQDVYTEGLPVLNEQGVHATVFQSTAMLSSKGLLWEHALYWYRDHPQLGSAFEERSRHFMVREGYADLMTGQGLEQLVQVIRDKVPLDVVERLLQDLETALGTTELLQLEAEQIYPTVDMLLNAASTGYEIGSHGHCHLKRDTCGVERYRQDLEASRASLEQWFGPGEYAFSYPFNNYDDGDGMWVREIFPQIATVNKQPILTTSSPSWMPRYTWPGVARNGFRRRRWLISGKI